MHGVWPSQETIAFSKFDNGYNTLINAVSILKELFFHTWSMHDKPEQAHAGVDWTKDFAISFGQTLKLYCYILEYFNSLIAKLFQILRTRIYEHEPPIISRGHCYAYAAVSYGQLGIMFTN
jgi:hypothetical protein